MEDPVEKARRIIKENRYMTLASCNGESVWIAPLAYVIDADYKFYWYSAIGAIHSEYIEHNPNVMVAIFNSTESSDDVDGLQIAGVADVIGEDDLPRVIDLYWRQSFPDENVRARWIRPAEDFKGSAIQRFYRFRPTRVYKPDPSSTKVDRRLEVNLAELRRIPAHS